MSDAPTTLDPPAPPERVLSTLNKDGSRRWLRPWSSIGIFLTGRRVVAYGLMLVFTGLPYLEINGKPPLLFDIPKREFTFFGTTFLPTDTLLLAFLLLSIFITIFLLTALFGRVWCGWGCPQTVYMEFLYRPIERLFEGRAYKSGGRVPVHPLRLVAKYVFFFLLSLYLAHTFLAYFVGVDELARWVRRSPFEHPTAFVIMAFTTILMMLDFCYFREQLCILMCPYGRLQSVLLDRQSLIVGYDSGRGEPRGKIKKKAPEASRARGDCIDCKLCVVTCPTGIDIRDGLQMECIGCAQCVDACDRVMTRIGRAKGLIRYSSQESMETGVRKFFRPRVVIYPVLLFIVVGLFATALANRSPADVRFLRNRNETYRLLDTGAVSNVVEIKITNRTEQTRTYAVDIPEASGVSSSDLPMTVEPGAFGAATLHLNLPRDRFARGRAGIVVVVADDRGVESEHEHHVLGPLFAGDAAGEGP